MQCTIISNYVNLFIFQALDVPNGFVPTASGKRGWLIHPMGEEETIPIWAIFFALIPALLLFILLFMETQITRSG